MATITEIVRVIVEATQKGVSRTLNQTSQQLQNMRRKVVDFNKTMREGQVKTKAFKVEMLGIMFLGMALQRVFLGMLKPAAELFGIFEIWGSTLQIVFLPIMDSLFPLFLKFNEMLINLSENTKLNIGIFTLFMGVVGVILTIIGAAVLGIAAVVSAVGAVPALIITAITIAVVAITILLIKLWNDLKRFPEDLALTWEMFKNAVTQKFKDLVEDLRNIWKIIKTIFVTSWTFIKNLFLRGMVTGLIIKNWSNIVGFFKDKVFAPLKTLFSGFLDFAKNIWNSIIDGIKSAIDKVNIFKKKEKGSSSTGTGGKVTRVNDFVMRPGQSPVSINPNDTLIGFKGANPLGGGTNIVQNITVSGALKETVDMAIRENNQKLFDQIQRLTSNRG